MGLRDNIWALPPQLVRCRSTHELFFQYPNASRTIAVSVGSDDVAGDVVGACRQPL